MSDRTSLEVNGEYLNTSYTSNNLFGSRQWVNQDWLNRKVFSQVTAGLGLDLEYWDIDRNPSQTSEEVLARAIYWAASKLELAASAGPEWRQYGGNAPATLEPVFNLAGNFYPRDSTTVSLEGHRSQEVSAAYGNADFILTGFSLALRQRLAARWTVAVSSGYDLAQYHATTAPASNTRSDDYFNARLGLDYGFSSRWQGGVFYQYRQDYSSLAIGFHDNRTGVRVSWRF